VTVPPMILQMRSLPIQSFEGGAYRALKGGRGGSIGRGGGGSIGKHAPLPCSHQQRHHSMVPTAAVVTAMPLSEA
jgi:hypothetical protein